MCFSPFLLEVSAHISRITIQWIMSTHHFSLLFNGYECVTSSVLTSDCYFCTFLRRPSPSEKHRQIRMIINNVGYSHNLQMDIAKINAIVNTQQFWFIVNQFVFDSDKNNNKNNNVQISTDPLDRSTFEKFVIATTICWNLQFYLYIFEWNSPWKRNSIIWSTNAHEPNDEYAWICESAKCCTFNVCKCRCWKCENVSDVYTFTLHLYGVQCVCLSDNRIYYLLHISCSFIIFNKILLTLSSLRQLLPIIRRSDSNLRFTNYVFIRTFIDLSIS